MASAEGLAQDLLLSSTTHLPERQRPFRGPGAGPIPMRTYPSADLKGLLCSSMSPVALAYPQAGPNFQLKYPERRLGSQEEEGLAYASPPCPPPQPPALLVMGGKSGSAQKHSAVHVCILFPSLY